MDKKIEIKIDKIDKKNNKKMKNRFFRNLAIYLLLVLIVVAAVYGFGPAEENEDPYEGNYYAFIEDLALGGIKEVTVVQEGSEYRIVSGATIEGKEFSLIAPPDDDSLLYYIYQAGIPYYQEKPAGTPIWVTFITSILPFVIIMGLMYFMLNNAGGNGKIMNFGKSRAKMLTDKDKAVTFKDVAGVEEEKEELEEIVEYLKNPQKYTDMGAKLPKGVLLFGNPGTGKTLLARAVAGEAGVPFFSISGSDFLEMFVGVGASRVRDLFSEAKKNSPCIVFIDEIDAVGRMRGTGLGGGHDEREQTLNQLLVEMDGFEVNNAIIVMAATNRPDVLDPALLRPGRFDRQICVSNPDLPGREEILKIHAANKPLEEGTELSLIAKQTIGFTGADLANLMNEAALLAVRRGKKKISLSELQEAIERVMAGPEKKSKKVSDYERRLTAYHESGHAIVAACLAHTDPVYKITITPRGMAGGYTMTMPEKDVSFTQKSKMLDHVKELLGGRIAESLVLDEISTGASNDLERASKIIRKMITEFGMSEAMGSLTYGTKQEQVFLGRDYSQNRDYSDAVAEEIDQEARRIMSECYKEAEDILKKNIEVLKSLAEALLEKETLDTKEINEIFKAGGIIKPTPQMGKLDEKWEKERQEKKEAEAKALEEAEKEAEIPEEKTETVEKTEEE